ncbi:MAG: leishmanolysin-related zinc metalloendopeptidase [Gemmatimonadota bacterium]
MHRPYPQSLPPAVVLLLGVLLAACGEDGPPPPASIEGTTAAAQTGTVGEAVATAPAVLVEDAAGNPLPGARVTFGVVSGGGSVAAASATTNMAGRASAGTWTLGPTVGEQVVQASAGSLSPVRFTAQAGPGAPASLVALQGDGQMGMVGEALAVRPSVRVEDGFGNPAQGTVVSFQVTAGDGSVSGGNVQAGADGTASPLEWRLGGTAGLNTLSAMVSGLTPVDFNATGERGPASMVGVRDGDNQVASIGQPVPIPPSVLVSDDFGNGVQGATVTFQIETGDGSVAGGTVVTGTDGVAAAMDWTLGSSPGAQSLIATADLVPGDTARLAAVAMPISEFDIEVRFLSETTTAQQFAFAVAQAVWRSAIIGDIIAAQINNQNCLEFGPFTEIVDDLLILAEVIPIDGPGNILGRAGPCLVRTSNDLPAVGIMSFDEADLASLEAAGLLDEVIVHEMGHVLGLGTVKWAPPLLMRAGTNDPIFTGAATLTAFDNVGGASYTGDPVPVENIGEDGDGTYGVHWRESVFDNELMTGFLNAGVNPLSVVSIASMEDLGYLIDLGAADPYMLPAPGVAAARAAAGTRFRLREAPMPPPKKIDP